MLVVARIVTMPRMIIAMMMGVPGNDRVGMLQFHHGARSQHVNERDHDDQKSLENAAHFEFRCVSNGCVPKPSWCGTLGNTYSASSQMLLWLRPFPQDSVGDLW